MKMSTKCDKRANNFSPYLIIFGVPEHNTMFKTIRFGERIDHSTRAVSPLKHIHIKSYFNPL